MADDQPAPNDNSELGRLTCNLSGEERTVLKNHLASQLDYVEENQGEETADILMSVLAKLLPKENNDEQ